LLGKCKKDQLLVIITTLKTLTMGLFRYMHGTPAFLPWHRYYISVLEKMLQIATGNPSFGLPYWDWAADADDWFLESAGVLTPTLMGTTGNGTQLCVTDGFMRNTWIPDDGSPCLMRSYNAKSSSNNLNVTLYDEPYMLLSTQVDPQTQKRYADYNAFRENLEGQAHNLFHMAIAGPSYDAHMADPRKSVNDPTFWMHHNNINRYWVYFQKSMATSTNATFQRVANMYNGFENRPPASNRNVAVSSNDIMPGFNVPISLGMGFDTGIYKCVKYIPFSKGLASVVATEVVMRGRRNVEMDHAHTMDHDVDMHHDELFDDFFNVIPMNDGNASSLTTHGKSSNDELDWYPLLQHRVPRSTFKADTGVLHRKKRNSQDSTTENTGTSVHVANRNAKRRVYERSKKKGKNRRPGGGKNTFKTLDEKVKSRLSRIDEFLQVESSELANVFEGKKTHRKEASKVKRAFLMLMGMMDVKKQREMEAKSKEMMALLHNVVDDILEKEFKTTFEGATFEEHSQAVKIAIAELRSSKFVPPTNKTAPTV
jgi:tyrosinase